MTKWPLVVYDRQLIGAYRSPAQQKIRADPESGWNRAMDLGFDGEISDTGSTIAKGQREIIIFPRSLDVINGNIKIYKPSGTLLNQDRESIKINS